MRNHRTQYLARRPGAALPGLKRASDRVWGQVFGLVLLAKGPTRLRFVPHDDP